MTLSFYINQTINENQGRQEDLDRSAGTIHKVYPSWLLAGNGLFLASAAAAIFFFWRHRQGSGKLTPEFESGTRNNRTTALLWVMSPLAILISINLLVMWVAVAGSEFR